MEMLRFGNVSFEVDRALLRDSNGAEVALRPKSLDLLLTLARNRGPSDVARRAVRRRLARRDGHRGQYRSVRTRGSTRDRRPRGADPAHGRKARLSPGHRSSIRDVDHGAGPSARGPDRPGSAVARRLAVSEHPLRSGHGMVRRRDRGGDHHGLVALPHFVCDRPQLGFHLQGPERGRP